MATFVSDDAIEELLSELVEAHLDTIELFVGPDDATTRAYHREYLQGLVRHSKRLIAHRAAEPRAR